MTIPNWFQHHYVSIAVDITKFQRIQNHLLIIQIN